MSSSARMNPRYQISLVRIAPSGVDAYPIEVELQVEQTANTASSPDVSGRLAWIRTLVRIIREDTEGIEANYSSDHGPDTSTIMLWTTDWKRLAPILDNLAFVSRDETLLPAGELLLRDLAGR